MTLQDSPKFIFSLELRGGRSRYVARDGLITDPFGQVHVPANLSAQQAEAAGLLMSGTYGPPCIGLSASAALSWFFGEQSGSSHANNWIDLVQADVEALGYAFGAVAFPSASVGAPHQRDRAYWVADTDCEQHQERYTECRKNNGEERCWQAKQFTGRGESCCMADTGRNGWQGRLSGRTDAERKAIDRPAGRGCPARGAGPVNGFWRDADWLHCRDGKWRPVRPGSFPMVDGVPGRVGRLRAYGNAINIEAATAFIKAYMAAVDHV